MSTNELLFRVAEHLDVDGGLVASVEHPGCVVIPARVGGGSYWWGTANATWGADVLNAAGAVVGSMATDLSTDCDDPSMIALVIARAMLGEPLGALIETGDAR